jgi:hypothetical protein
MIIQQVSKDGIKFLSPLLLIAISTLRMKQFGQYVSLVAEIILEMRHHPIPPGHRAPVNQISRARSLPPAAGKFIPRTNGWQSPAKDAVPHRFAKFACDMALVLDGEIGNAAPRIELIRCWKGLGGADIQTRMTGAAVINLWLIRGKDHVSQYCTDEKP